MNDLIVESQQAAYQFVLAVLSDDKPAACAAIKGVPAAALILQLSAIIRDIAEQTHGVEQLKEALILSAADIDLTSPLS